MLDVAGPALSQCLSIMPSAQQLVILVRAGVCSSYCLTVVGACRVEASQRFGVVQRFNADPTIPVMLLTTHVGGLGLNLTAADTVIFLEHDWNPMKDLQVRPSMTRTPCPIAPRQQLPVIGKFGLL